jgi:hypothetical protein
MKMTIITRVVKNQFRFKTHWMLAIPFLFIMGMCEDDKDEISPEEYWADKSYDLTWDCTVWETEGYTFKGSVWECEIGDINASAEIFFQDDEGDWTAEGTYNETAPLAPLTNDPDLPRSFQMTLTGEVTSYEGGSCDLTLEITVDYMVNVENNTGTMKWMSTRINNMIISCEGAPPANPTSPAILFTSDQSMEESSTSHCL